MTSRIALPVDSLTLPQALAEAHAALRAERLEQAERGYRAILRVDARRAEALHGLGLVAMKANHSAEAERLIRAAIALDPEADVYRTSLGNVLLARGLPAEAVDEYERALQLRPESVAALSNLGVTLLGLGRAEDAVSALTRAAARRPDWAQVADNLGNALQAAGRPAQAVVWHQRALVLAPAHVEARGNLGLALAGMGRWAEAMAHFEEALRTAPENARIQLARAQMQLLLGNFEQGWVNYEWRKRVHAERPLAGREWTGEAIADGETLLLYAEQGLGDTIQFVRYLKQAASRIGAKARLILEVQEPMRRLMQGIAETVVVPGEAKTEWHCSLMSLPLVLGAGENPECVPYLCAPREPPTAVRLPTSTSRMRVGVVWAGNPRHVRDRFRSLPFPMFEPLLGMAGVELHSLQIGEAAGEAEGRLADWSSSIHDMADTAAIVEQLDLVIGADTAVVHLAGALGKRVWTVLPFWPDWRWGLEREDCAWYPTMRLFRQEKAGDWPGVMDRVRLALRAELSQANPI